jgi:hypothetical protein
MQNSETVMPFRYFAYRIEMEHLVKAGAQFSNLHQLDLASLLVTFLPARLRHVYPRPRYTTSPHLKGLAAVPEALLH